MTTRAGNIPLQDCNVLLDSVVLGKTDDEGKSPRSPRRSEETALIEVHYENAVQGLKKEVLTLPLVGISAESGSYTVGNGKDFISKIQYAPGSGAGSMPGDLDFEDEYAYSASMVSTEHTENSGTKLLKVAVRMATFSLQVRVERLMANEGTSSAWEAVS